MKIKDHDCLNHLKVKRNVVKTEKNIMIYIKGFCVKCKKGYKALQRSYPIVQEMYGCEANDYRWLNDDIEVCEHCVHEIETVRAKPDHIIAKYCDDPQCTCTECVWEEEIDAKPSATGLWELI